MRWMIYGATGYTGGLATRMAAERSWKPVLAGRRSAAVEAFARRFGFEFRAFSMDDHPAIVSALRDVDAVFHSAGPYSATAAAMASACLEAGTHYVDVSAENDAIRALQARDSDAKKAGVMLLPAVGAGGGPTDCLAAHLKQRLPAATQLDFFGGSLEVVSRGTAKSAMEAVHRRTQVRSEGRLVDLEDDVRVRVEIEGKEIDCVTVPLCDIVVAHWSSRIPNITTFVEEAGAVKQMASVPRWAKRLLATELGQKLVKWQLDRGVAGPSDAERAAGLYRNTAVASAGTERVAATAHGPEGYTLTALSALEAVRRAASGEARPGYQTASTAYGVEFFSSIEGCRIEDIEAPRVMPR